MEKTKIIELLNKRMAEEWLAHYQYWIGAYVAQGQLRPDIADEMNAHAAEEREHADKLATRIIELGGVPVLDPKQWFSIANAAYIAPISPFNTIKLVDDSDKGELQAIANYTALAKALDKSDDQVTYLLIMEILSDEQRHHNDWVMYKKDFDLIKS